MKPAITNASFESLGVCEVLCEAAKKLDWHHPTNIQEQAIPVALQGRDVIGLAATGSGKTGAFALPILQSLLADPSPMVALVLAPTHELAFQICEQFAALGSIINLRTCVLVGGADQMQQALALAKRPHVIIGTPGRVQQHLETTKGFSLKQTLRFLVLDEADRMLSMNFEESLTAILKHLPSSRRTFLFSATMTSSVAKLERASLVDPVKVSVTNNRFGTVAELKQMYLLCPAKWKMCYTAHVLAENSGQAVMIFCATGLMAQRLSLILKVLGIQSTVLTGKMSQAKRVEALTRFRAQDRQVLVATDVASRGLDIPCVDLVINFDMPLNAKDYVHRVGRTARAGRSGSAVTLVTQYDVAAFKSVEELTQQRMPAYVCDEKTVLEMLPQVELAEKLAHDDMKEIEAKEKQKKRNKKKRDGKKKGGADDDDEVGGGDDDDDDDDEGGGGFDTERGALTKVGKKNQVKKKKI